MTAKKSASFLCIFFFSPWNVVEHGHEEDSAFELLWITLSFFHKFLNLFKEAQCCGPWEYVPLDQMITLDIPLNFLLPSLVRVFFYTSETEHRVGKDAGLGIQELMKSVTQQACRAPCALRNQSLTHQ